MKKHKSTHKGGEKFKIMNESTINKIAIIILIILPLIYFAPLLSGSKMMYGSDWLTSGVASRQWSSEAIRNYGEAARWNPMVFCGLPNDNPITFHTLWYLIFKTHVGWTYLFVFSMMFAGLGMYLYIKGLKLSLYIALIAGIAYMGCGSVLSMTSPGHETKILACAFFPFILLFLHKGLITKKFPYFLIAGGLGGLAAVNAHFQLIYYAAIVLAFYFLFHLIWQRKENGQSEYLIIIGGAVSGLILAIGMLAIKYLPTLMAIEWGARGAERGYAFATSWSLAPNELLDLLTPYFSGAVGIGNRYWGENYFKLDTQYIAILPMILALVAIIYKIKNNYVRFFLGLSVVSTIFAFGGHTPLYRIPYHILPMLNKFRGPSMIFYLVAFSTIVLSAYGTQYLLNKEKRKEKKIRNLIILIVIVFAVVLLFTLVCTLGKTSVQNLIRSYIEPVIEASYGKGLAQQKMQIFSQNYPDFIRGMWRTLLLIIISSILILLLALRKIKLTIFTIITILVVIFDQWSIEKKFLDTVPHPSTYYAPDEIVRYLKGDNSFYRVFPLQYEHTRDGYLTIHGIQSLGGYVSNPGKRYQEFIGAGESVMFNYPNLIRHRNLLNILNTKYVVDVFIPEDISGFDENTQNAIENFKFNFLRQWGISWEDAHNGFKAVHTTRQGYAVYLNETSLPRVWLVPDYEILDKDKVLERLIEPEFNPRLSVIFEEDPGVPHQDTLTNIGNIKLTNYQQNEITCEAALNSPGFLVLSENWHPDWRVLIDGVRSKLYKANYTLRAVYLPEGSHTINFIYISRPFQIGSIISIISLIFFAGVIVWVGISKFQKRLK
ncbi:YfhO family protein [candidate division WOR-3 bacterium]|nr:YfhO family protein [candidate division WOR-3 bacterium]